MAKGEISKEALAKIQKTFGKENIFNVNSGPEITIPRIPSGSLYLDHILGGNERDGYGWPKGRIVEIYGEESSGKSSTCLHLIAEAQKKDIVCSYIDLEATYDPEYAETLGVDNDKLVYSCPENGETAINLARALVDSGEVGVVIFDSTEGLVPKSELEGEAEDFAVGSQARLLAKAMRMLMKPVEKSDVLCVFISQIRMSIGVSFGDPRVIGKGKALAFASSIRLEVSKTKAKSEGTDDPYGHPMKFYTRKNKVNAPFKRCGIFFRYGIGFDKYSEIVDLATQMEVINKSGSWYSYGDTRLGQGAEAVMNLLKDNPELFEELKAKVIDGLSQQ